MPNAKDDSLAPPLQYLSLSQHYQRYDGRLEKPKNYYIDTVAIPEEIKQRLITYTDKYVGL